MSRTRAPAPSPEEALGHITVAWSTLEHGLTTVLGQLIETDFFTAVAISAALDHRHRRDLINSLAGIKVREQSTLSKLVGLMGEVKGMAKERNEAVHAFLVR